METLEDIAMDWMQYECHAILSIH